MDEFTGIQTSLFLMLLLHFTGAAELIVRDGDEITLPCRIGIDGLDNCNSTTWLYSNSRSRPAVELTDGQTGEQAEDKSDRLSVSENCSLVIKKVTEEDAGQYGCRQLNEYGSSTAYVYPSVVTMTEQKDSDEVTLTCSVRTFGGCHHTVKWLFQGQDVDDDIQDVKTSQSDCSANETFRTSFSESKHHELFKCEVTNIYNGEFQQFDFSPQSSGEESTPSGSTPSGSTPSAPEGENQTAPDWSVLDAIMLAIRVAELLLLTVITVLLIRAAGKQKPPDDNTVTVLEDCEWRSGPAASQVNVDEDEGVVNYENDGEPPVFH